ncbi:MAG: archease, partial [Gammaproteobacteria bacterium]
KPLIKVISYVGPLRNNPIALSFTLTPLKVEKPIPHWEHFEHAADIGIRGVAPTPAQAFEQAATAMTAVICDPATITPLTQIALRCQASDLDILFFDWINELVYQMAVTGLLFRRFAVDIDNDGLTAIAYGEPADREKHRPAVEIKGATMTELRVFRQDGLWMAQCIVDV